jgi:hypothetical protein
MRRPQVGYKVVPERKVRKPELGHLKKAGCPPLKHLREFKVCMCVCVCLGEGREWAGGRRKGGRRRGGREQGGRR